MFQQIERSAAQVNSLAYKLTTAHTHQFINSLTQKLTNSLTQKLTNSKTQKFTNSKTPKLKPLSFILQHRSNFRSVLAKI